MEARSPPGVKITRKKSPKGGAKKSLLRHSKHKHPPIHLGRSRPFVIERWTRVRDGDRHVIGELRGILNVARRLAPQEAPGAEFVLRLAQDIMSGKEDFCPIPKEVKSGKSQKAQNSEEAGRTKNCWLTREDIHQKTISEKNTLNNLIRDFGDK